MALTQRHASSRGKNSRWFATGALVMVVSTLTGAQRAPAVATQDERRRDLWFVELASPPAADGTSVGALEQEKQAFRAAAAARGLRIEERFAFNSLWNGVSIRIDPAEARFLATLPGVRAVYPVELAYADPERPAMGPNSTRRWP